MDLTSHFINPIRHAQQTLDNLATMPYVGLLSEHIADRLINENGLIEILADLPKPEFAVHLLYVKHRHQTALIRAFLDFIDGKITT